MVSAAKGGTGRAGDLVAGGGPAWPASRRGRPRPSRSLTQAGNSRQGEPFTVIKCRNTVVLMMYRSYCYMKREEEMHRLTVRRPGSIVRAAGLSGSPDVRPDKDPPAPMLRRRDRRIACVHVRGLPVFRMRMPGMTRCGCPAWPAVRLATSNPPSAVVHRYRTAPWLSCRGPVREFKLPSSTPMRRTAVRSEPRERGLPAGPGRGCARWPRGCSWHGRERTAGPHGRQGARRRRSSMTCSTAWALGSSSPSWT